ncbi:hypothetical protein BKA62DRAFT_758357 [Auriculariales sp. MPI-PUGE-AT-0066]|nr:hypothetical protein BKA62DRAFT_758357 [Auriculariales sp. MPI-PUGE-AT-0066]
MPRSSRSSRPAPRPAAQQTRGHATMAAPAAAARAPMAPPAATAVPAAAPTSSGPGMLGQMAATAGSVAVGSTIGHGLSNMLFGGGGSAAAPEAAAPVQQQQIASQCDFQVKEFTKCLETNDLNGCNWFLDQLKSKAKDVVGRDKTTTGTWHSE